MRIVTKYPLHPNQSRRNTLLMTAQRSLELALQRTYECEPDLRAIRKQVEGTLGMVVAELDAMDGKAVVA